MKGNDSDERREPSNNSIGNMDVEKEEEDEEALSLCDLPVNQDKQLLSREESPKPINNIDSQEEFNFCSSWGDSNSKEPEICTAEEVFFRGQILPLGHSFSSESGFLSKLQSESRTISRCISRSESTDDHCNSVGFTSVSSRSSSINSHHSSSSSCGTSSTTTTGSMSGSRHKPRHKIRNQFQYSHPSPKPQIRSSNIINGINCNNSNRKSTLWSIFRVGLVTTPEIAIQDIKFRTKSNTTSFGSRNSTSSISSGTFSTSIACKIKADEKQQIKRKPKLLEYFNGCKCSSNAVVGPTPPKVAEIIKRSASSVNEVHADEEDMKKLTRTTKQQQHQQQAGKQALSRHRTFEWLKQLSLEADAVIDEA